MNNLPDVDTKVSPKDDEGRQTNLRWRIYWGRALFALGCLALWQWGHSLVGDDFVAAPLQVLLRIIELTRSGDLLIHAAATFEEAALGFLFGGVAGIILPFLLRLSPRLTEALDPFIAAGTGVPKLSLAPLLILWFGIGLLSKVVFVASLVFFLLFFNTLAGVRSVDPRLEAMTRVLGSGEWLIAREIVWNTALPFIFAGIKIAMPRAISAAVVGEFIAADVGLGYYINNSRSMVDTVGLFAGIVLVTLLVIIINVILQIIQSRSLGWRPMDRDMVA